MTIGQVVAKMKCHEASVTTFSETYKQNKIKMGAVCGRDGENADFTKLTPSGELWMNIQDGAPAADFFKPGKNYYVTFTEAPD